ncbi:MAG: hypothetical protein VKK59_00955 [Vampirovibrionales bacterium]|nr:hypothetical protein [Vampirovibrionales bacterium]
MDHAVEAIAPASEEQMAANQPPAFVPKNEPVVWVWITLFGAPLLLLYLLLSKA